MIDLLFSISLFDIFLPLLVYMFIDEGKRKSNINHYI
jgi:hypothetical protein